jgi:N-acetylmuramoyl-L-alanine amidase
MRQTLRHDAAPSRTLLRVLLTCALVLSLFPLAGRADDSSRREAAKSQFDRAEKAREALESRSENARTQKDYTALVIQYQRVYLTSTHGAEIPTSLNEVAELFRTMGDLFDSKYYQRSIDAFQFLLKQYPASKYREDALLAIAQIEQEDLHDAVLAQKTYEQFLTLHPRSSHAAEVRAALGRLNGESGAAKPASVAPAAAAKDRSDRPTVKNVSADKTPPTTDTNQGDPADSSDSSGSSTQVSRIRTWNADTYTRIVIDVGSKVKYQAARISGPDRIYFDIEGSKLSSALVHKPVDIESNGLLKTVRVAQYQSGVVRVVLEVNGVTDYSVFLLPDPYRLVVDVYGTSAGAEAAARDTAPPPGPTTTDTPAANSDRPAKESSAKASPGAEKGSAKPVTTSNSGSTAAASADATGDSKPAAAKTASISGKNSKAAASSGKPAQSGDSDGTTLSASASRGETDTPALASQPSATSKPSRPAKSAHDQAEEMGPPSTPELMRDGQHSLTRALGLKIGRIVIDPGHGGRDTGTIGPTGLMEKDLCLDVALRLGKIIQQKLPTADVVFTRSDDTFVPLERRTEIANEAKADLFISVHANSSQDRKARGVETYYLNFTGSSDAMEVASRENALSENAVHDLQDILKKIASNEKIDESRDLAGRIQDALSNRMENLNRGDRNRGVRKAPFVVLIGADMPSVLSEISFLSNPNDEKWLKNPDNRQRVADGLYRGIETYLQSTNSLSSNQLHSAAENFAGKVARAGNSQ